MGDTEKTTEHQTRTQIRCTTCRRSGWIDYQVRSTTMATHMGQVTNTTLSHPQTASSVLLRRKGDRERFLLAAARRVQDCGHPLKVVDVQGLTNERVPCDDRCMGAVGPSCSCSCGGENHGNAHGTW